MPYRTGREASIRRFPLNKSKKKKKKLVALNFISVFLFSGYRPNRVIALGVSSVFLFALVSVSSAVGEVWCRGCKLVVGTRFAICY